MQYGRELLNNEEKNVLPQAKESDLIELLAKLKRIAPDYKSDSEKARYLLNLITYVDGIINGDDIRQFTTYHYTTKFARQALQEISTEIQEQIMEQYKLEKARLQAELKRLYEEHRMLSDDTARLQDEKAGLIKSKANLTQNIADESRKLSELRTSLQNEKENGLKKVEASINERRKKLNAELQALSDQKETLAKALAELQKSFNEYSTRISDLTKENTSNVEWAKIPPTHAIYKTNAFSIEAFVKVLHLEYMEKTHCSKDECERAFATYCPELPTFISVLKKYTNDIPACASVSSMLKYNNWVASAQKDTNMLKAMLESMKLPTYEPKLTNVDTLSLTADTVPSNLNGIMRELHLRRIAAEALTKQKIAEAELATVLGILKSVLPPEYDLNSLLSKYNALDLGEYERDAGRKIH